jgi:dTDP-4-dehydrorhamnose 3,5-epimerase
MHFQHEPFSEAKYVRCTAGSVMDILLDTRVDSPTYGLADAVELDHRESMAVFIPSGCAHGFQSLQGDSRIHYLVSEKFTPTAESGDMICVSKHVPSMFNDSAHFPRA